jgi:hypothetical protein
MNLFGPPAWGLGEVLTTPHRKKITMLRNTIQSLGTGCCECGNEPSGSIKRGEFLD